MFIEDTSFLVLVVGGFTFRMSKMDTKKSVSSVILTAGRAVNGSSVNNRINETEAKIGI